MGRARRRAGLAVLAVVSGAACNPSRDEPEAEPVQTVVVDLPVPTADILPAGETSSAIRDESPSSAPLSPNVAAPTELDVPFDDYFDVDQLGSEPVRGSGCGVATFIGDQLPDGLWRGFVRSFDGLWVDGATSLEFDLACVYVGGAAVDAEQRWRDEHPGQEPILVPDGFLANNNDRVRTVPLAASFVQVDAAWEADGRCLPPDELPPSGSTEVYRLLDSWLFVVGGQASWAVTSCVPQ